MSGDLGHPCSNNWSSRTIRARHAEKWYNPASELSISIIHKLAPEFGLLEMACTPSSHDDVHDLTHVRSLYVHAVHCHAAHPLDPRHFLNDRTLARPHSASPPPSVLDSLTVAGFSRDQVFLPTWAGGPWVLNTPRRLPVGGKQSGIAVSPVKLII